MDEFIMLFLFQTTGGPGAIRAGGGGTIPINDIRGTLSLSKDNSTPGPLNDRFYVNDSSSQKFIFFFFQVWKEWHTQNKKSLHVANLQQSTD